MQKQKNQMQSKTTSLYRSSTGDIDETRNKTSDISERIAAEVKKQLQEVVKEIRSQNNLSGKEKNERMKELLTISKEDVDQKVRGAHENDGNLE